MEYIVLFPNFRDSPLVARITTAEISHGTENKQLPSVNPSAKGTLGFIEVMCTNLAN